MIHPPPPEEETHGHQHAQALRCRHGQPDALDIQQQGQSEEAEHHEDESAQVSPQSSGSSISIPTRNKNVLAKEITADTSPLESAVNSAEAKMLIPIRRKLTA